MLPSCRAAFYCSVDGDPVGSVDGDPVGSVDGDPVGSVDGDPVGLPLTVTLGGGSDSPTDGAAGLWTVTTTPVLGKRAAGCRNMSTP